MAALLRIDEINKPFDSDSYMSDYFAAMLISQLRKDMRLKAAKDIREVILYIYDLIDIMENYGELDWSYVESKYRDEFGKAVIEHSRDNQEVQDYIAEKSEDFMRITRENLADDEYWTSAERAAMEAVNVANQVVGYEEYNEALEEGKLYKVWRTMNDDFVRPTHKAVNGKKLEIHELFQVGKGYMRFPLDWKYNRKECYGCRCGIDYV